MPLYVHAPMQDTGDVHGVVVGSKDDEMPTGWKYPVCRREFGVRVADLRVLPDRQQRLVEYGAVGVELRLTPCFKRVLQDVRQIIFRLRGED